MIYLQTSICIYYFLSDSICFFFLYLLFYISLSPPLSLPLLLSPFLSYMHITSSFLFLFLWNCLIFRRKLTNDFSKFMYSILKTRKINETTHDSKYQKKLWWSFYCGICAFIERAYFQNFRNSLRIESSTIWAKERKTKVKTRAVQYGIFVMDLKFLGNAGSFIYQTYWRQHQ